MSQRTLLLDLGGIRMMFSTSSERLNKVCLYLSPLILWYGQYGQLAICVLDFEMSIDCDLWY